MPCKRLANRAAIQRCSIGGNDGPRRVAEHLRRLLVSVVSSDSLADPSIIISVLEVFMSSVSVFVNNNMSHVQTSKKLPICYQNE
ncbi:hypothetical protein NQ318_018397 [Aromia moschata]|uniref:Uncharacterized protein n=1 Tax=Aromia moschata TaxID=1265417 RepID=A0AAV8XAX2_9CUCU|nr:hypothetical protein NQ318_018397 [Aromia moschata]